MLVLSRKDGQSVMVGGVEVIVAKSRDGKVK